MKYLEIEEISKFNTTLSRIEASHRGLLFKLEAYSLKETRRQKKEKSKTSTYLFADVLNMAFPDYTFK